MVPVYNNRDDPDFESIGEDHPELVISEATDVGQDMEAYAFLARDGKWVLTDGVDPARFICKLNRK